MSIVTKPNTFVANQIIDANQMNQNFDSVYGVVNGGLDASNIAVNGINDYGKIANEVVIPSKSKGLLYSSDLFSQSWVVAGGLATFSGSPANQIQVNTVSANVIQIDGTYRHMSVAATSYTTSALNSTYYLDLQPDGTISWATTHSTQTGYLPLASVTTNGSGNVLAITDVRVLSAGIAWINLSKVSSSLADLATRSAADLTSGTLPAARLPARTGDVTSPAGSGVNTITPGIIQNSHVNAAAAIGWSKISKVGSSLLDLSTRSASDLNSGTLPVAQVPTAIPAINIGTGAVDNTHLNYLQNVTSDIQTQLNSRPVGLTGNGNPNGAVTAAAIGQLYTDTNTGITYTATAANNSSWIVPTEYYGMALQAIINGNFDMWQRGTSFTNPAIVYTSDRWRTSWNVLSGTFPTNIIHSKQSLTPGDIPNSYSFYRINVDGAGSGQYKYQIIQLIENGTRYLCGASRKVTISFYARSSITGKKLGLSMVQNYGSGGSSSAAETLPGNNVSLTTSWVKYAVTVTTNTLVGKTFGTNNDDYLRPTFAYAWDAATQTDYGASAAENFGGAGNIDIAQVEVNAGDVALSFEPRDIDDETKKTLRFTWIPQTNSVFARLISYTANTLVFNIPLPVQMRTAPTIKGTINTDMIAYNMSASAQTGFTAAATLTSNGVIVTMTKTTHGLTDAYLEIKTTSGFDAEL